MKKIKKILAVVFCLVFVGLIVFAIFGDAAMVPKLEDISERMEYLIEESYGVNVYLFGEGHATYERVYDPKASMQYTVTDGGQRYY